MRLGSTHTFSVLTVYRSHRIARPQNPFFVGTGAGGSGLMLFTNGGIMEFTSDLVDMEFTDV